MTTHPGSSAAVPVPGNSGSRPEPVLAAAIVPIVAAVLSLLVAFGVDMSDDERNAVLGIATALVPVTALLANWIARNKVTPVANPHDSQNRPLVPVPPPAGPPIGPPPG